MQISSALTVPHRPLPRFPSAEDRSAGARALPRPRGWPVHVRLRSRASYEAPTSNRFSWDTTSRARSRKALPVPEAGHGQHTFFWRSRQLSKVGAVVSRKSGTAPRASGAMTLELSACRHRAERRHRRMAACSKTAVAPPAGYGEDYVIRQSQNYPCPHNPNCLTLPTCANGDLGACAMSVVARIMKRRESAGHPGTHDRRRRLWAGGSRRLGQSSR
jgi:hypothetical protein